MRPIESACTPKDGRAGLILAGSSVIRLRRCDRALKQLEIKLVRSLIGRKEDQRETVKSLGLHKLHQSVTRPDSPSLRGMLKKVAHLVEVTEGQA